jgi:hypothetical protein
VWDTLVKKQIINGLFRKTEAFMPIARYDPSLRWLDIQI